MVESTVVTTEAGRTRTPAVTEVADRVRGVGGGIHRDVPEKSDEAAVVIGFPVEILGDSEIQFKLGWRTVTVPGVDPGFDRGLGVLQGLAEDRIEPEAELRG